MEPRPISPATAEHYTWGEHCDGWHLVKDERLSVIAEQMPPGTSEVRHYHVRSQQFFWILSGEVVMEVDGSEIRLSAGEGVRVQPGTPHQIRNGAKDAVQFLVISQPPVTGIELGQKKRVNDAGSCEDCEIRPSRLKPHSLSDLSARLKSCPSRTNCREVLEHERGRSRLH